jgi:general secretion pathway protein D
VLGDIPVLGFLFKQSHREKQKSNLLLILTPYVIRDQDDLRSIFERKMQERQEFIDRYFVFSDRAPWAPPRDYTRANGLVEEIRQSILAQDERDRLERESLPKPQKDHAASAPIALPRAAGKPGSPSVEVTSGAPGAPGQGFQGPKNGGVRRPQGVQGGGPRRE